MLRVLSLISLISLSPQFAELRRMTMPPENTPCEVSEKSEIRPGRVLRTDMLFPFVSLFSQFAILCDRAGYAAHGGAVIEESQPTRCGHTLRGVHCRGLAGAFRPSTPEKAERQKP